jgi:hypothetical protein
MVGATESAPRESGSLCRAGLRCMLMSVERSCVPVVDSRDDPVTYCLFLSNGGGDRICSEGIGFASLSRT